MNNTVITTATVVSAAGAALNAGVFFAFSTFVMPALNRLPASQSVPAMQSINKLVPGSLFGASLLGTALTSAVLGLSLMGRWQRPEREWMFAGVLLYLVGGILITFIFNVPKNEALDLVKATDPDVDSKWSSFYGSWQAWNHVRTVACLAASAAFVMVLRTTGND